MQYHILYIDDKLVGITPFDWVALPGVQIKTIEEPIPDLNNVTWDTEELLLVPAPRTIITKLEFLQRFTQTERTALRQSQDTIIIDAMDLLANAEEVNLQDPRTIMPVYYFVQVGILTVQRAQEILQ